MRTVETKVFTFDELSNDAKEKARAWYREGAFDYEWWDEVYDDAVTIAKLMGIEIEDAPRGRTGPAIFFSGFSSQGDGACFEGEYAYAKGSAAKVREHAPKDTELHRIARELADIQRRHLYGLSASVKHRGHYYHEHCTEIDVFNRDGCVTDSDTADAIRECLRDFMRWIYRQLEREYEFSSIRDEQVDESIRANEYEFEEDGSRA